MRAVLARGSNSVYDKTGHYHISFGGLQGNFGVERLGTALLTRTYVAMLSLLGFSTVGLEVAYFRFSGTWAEMLLFMYVVLCCSAVPTVGFICSN